MSKGKSITLLTIISVLMAFLLVMTFLRFPIGVKDYNSPIGAVELDYDIAGGVAYTLALNENNEEEVGEEEVERVVEQIKSRLESLGYSTYSVKPLMNTDPYIKDYEIRVEVKETTSADEDLKAVTAYGELKFYGGAESATTQILEDIDVIEDSQYLGKGETSYVLSLVFTESGQKALLTAMGENETYYLKITCGLDEDNEEIALFNGTIQKSYIDNDERALQMNASSESTAKRMALQLREGGIEFRYDILNEDGMGTKIQTLYGKNVANKCLAAILTIAIISIVFLLVAYKGLGIIASLSYLLFAIAQPWLLIAIPGVVINLGSIIGIITAMLISLYALFRLLQNVKDEFANSEKTAKAAINKGFKDALVPTINIHVVSGIFALLLFIFAKGVVKGFAITCGVGIVLSAIANLVFTRMFKAVILPLPKNKEKFLKFKKVATAEEVE